MLWGLAVYLFFSWLMRQPRDTGSAASAGTTVGPGNGSAIQYSNDSGASLDDAVVVTGAASDLEGTAAIFQWLISRYGTMNVDWRLLGVSGHHDGKRRVDIYLIQLPSGERLMSCFDLTESFGKF